MLLIKVRSIIMAIAAAVCAFSCATVMANEPDKKIPAFLQDFLDEENLKMRGSFSTGFESEGEFAPFYIVPFDHKNTATHSLSKEQSVSGKLSHKAWMYGKNRQVGGTNTNHRAYPTFQLNKTSLGIVKTAVLVEFSVWADIDLFPTEDKSWFSLATFTSYDDIQWYRSYLINVDSDYKVHLMHVPIQGQSSPDIFHDSKISLPRKAWAKITAYIDYSKNNRFNSPIIAVWQDGALVTASRFSDRVDPLRISPALQPKCLKGWDKQYVVSAEKMCDLKYEGGLSQMHFGLYAPPLLSRGVIYNDDLSVTEIIKD
jgi:hypothetical protein